jgi:hypothetical protein
MSFAPVSPITGTAQTGLTSPTYTIVVDTPPDSNGKQYAVTVLGGTQTGVKPNLISSPFTLGMFRPKNFASVGAVVPATGQLRSVPKNRFSIVTRKGVVPLAGQASQNLVITTHIDVPAGADTADELSIRAALSAYFGCCNQNSAAIGDTIVSGVL